jgi:hypothetical protein
MKLGLICIFFSIFLMESCCDHVVSNIDRRHIIYSSDIIKAHHNFDQLNDKHMQSHRLNQTKFRPPLAYPAITQSKGVILGDNSSPIKSYSSGIITVSDFYSSNCEGPVSIAYHALGSCLQPWFLEVDLAGDLYSPISFAEVNVSISMISILVSFYDDWNCEDLAYQTVVQYENTCQPPKYTSNSSSEIVYTSRKIDFSEHFVQPPMNGILFK